MNYYNIIKILIFELSRTCNWTTNDKWKIHWKSSENPLKMHWKSTENPVKVEIITQSQQITKRSPGSSNDKITSYYLIVAEPRQTLPKAHTAGPVVEKISPNWPKATTNLISSNCLASELWFHKLLLSWCHCLSARRTLVSAVREAQAKTMTKTDICQVWGTTALFRPIKYKRGTK